MAAESIPMAHIFKLDPQAPPEDVQVVRRALAGDSAAFTAVYRQNLARVYAICLRMVADRGKAEELSQESLTKSWEMLGQYRGESPLSAWIRRIAVNVVLDYLRSQRRWAKRLEFTDQIESFDGPRSSESPEIQLDLEQAIATLPPQARAVIVLHDIEGYSHEEVSELMGIAIGTSKAHLHAARRMLKEVLQR